jgi:hypothetical protein
MYLPETLNIQSNLKDKSKPWPKFLRRGPMELVACCLITLGILMLLQPFALFLYTWSFLTMLFGTVMFTVVSKFPQ